jgi:nicotinamide phosphoribosyltransferase
MGILWERFGGRINDKGYKVLDDHVRVIQGDGVNIESIDAILYAMQSKGYSADNIAFGSGGALLQQLNRDTQRMVFKCSAIERDGQWESVWKDPITDHGKQSKRGVITTFRSKTGGFYAEDKRNPVSRDWEDGMVAVFRDGQILKNYRFEEVRENAK